MKLIPGWSYTALISGPSPSIRAVRERDGIGISNLNIDALNTQIEEFTANEKETGEAFAYLLTRLGISETPLAVLDLIAESMQHYASLDDNPDEVMDVRAGFLSLRGSLS